MISEQTGIDSDDICHAIDSVMKRAVDRAKRDQKKSLDDQKSSTSAVELVVMQYVFGVLDHLLDEVTIEEIRKERVSLGMSEKKLMN
jgi:hypothetical protein